MIINMIIILIRNNIQLARNISIAGGYKGYGLGMLVEIFCGILSGSAWGPNIRQWKSYDSVANLVR